METPPSPEQYGPKEEEIEIKSGFTEEIRNMSAEQILDHFQRGFIEGIPNFDVRALVLYIDTGKVDLEKNKLVTPELKKLIADVKKDPNYHKIMIVNPKLYFMTAKECGEMALKELVRRASGEAEPQ